MLELAQEKSVVKRTDPPTMTITVDLGRKATKQTKTNKATSLINSIIQEHVCKILFII